MFANVARNPPSSTAKPWLRIQALHETANTRAVRSTGTVYHVAVARYENTKRRACGVTPSVSQSQHGSSLSNADQARPVAHSAKWEAANKYGIEESERQSRAAKMPRMDPSISGDSPLTAPDVGNGWPY